MIALSRSARPVDRGSALDTLMAEARRDSAEFPVDLANHAPMVLAILDRLGAPEARLREHLDAYREANGLLPPPSSLTPIARDTWTAALGDRSREADYRTFFAGEVAALGIRGGLARYLPALAPGVAASALHPLMRLAYGILRDDRSEVAVALGYWAASFLPLPSATGALPRTDDPAEVLAGVAAMPGLRGLPCHSHLWHAIRAAAAEPAFAPVVDWLRIGPDTPARAAATALSLYAGTMDFAALHAVTACHWVRIVAAAYPEPLLLRHVWQVVAALVPAIGCPALPEPEALRDWRERPCPDWAAIAEATIRSDDEHDISLVFSAMEEERAYGDRLYRVVAARRMGLIP